MGEHCEKSMSLMTVPLEIRQHIYRYLLPFAVATRTHRGIKTIWHCGNTAVLATNRQIYAETTEQLYGSNLFEVDIGYGHMTFQFRKQLHSSLTSRRTPSFPVFFGSRNRRMIRHFLVNVDHVDSYTGMIKYNCGGAGLTTGIRKQIQSIVDLFLDAHSLISIQFNLRIWDTNAESVAVVLEPVGALRDHGVRVIVTGVVAQNSRGSDDTFEK